jgi:hypothetical protein
LHCLCDKKYIVGNITIDSEELTDGKADVLAFSFEKTEDSQKITTSIEGAGEVFIEYKTYTPDDKDYTVPADVVDFENIDAYLESVDIENFITDVFGALGINESIVDSYLSGVMYGMSNMDIIGEADEETSVMIGDFM